MFIFFILACLLSGQVFSFSITVGSRSLAATEILLIPESPVGQACASNCSVASSKIAACDDVGSCLCSADTVASLLDCETCMFHHLINTNTPAPDFRAGSTPVLQAYSSACNATANVVLAPNQIALQLPGTWDGPFVAVLPFGGALVVVILGGMIGMSALYMFANLL